MLPIEQAFEKRGRLLWLECVTLDPLQTSESEVDVTPLEGFAWFVFVTRQSVLRLE